MNVGRAITAALEGQRIADWPNLCTAARRRELIPLPGGGVTTLDEGIPHGNGRCRVVHRDVATISCIQPCIYPEGHDGLHTIYPGSGSGFTLHDAVLSWRHSASGWKRPWRQSKRVALGLERP